eukprot:15460343-Alexandrium_andersonii.AAC.1
MHCPAPVISEDKHWPPVSPPRLAAHCCLAPCRPCWVGALPVARACSALIVDYGGRPRCHS